MGVEIVVEFEPELVDELGRAGAVVLDVDPLRRSGLADCPPARLDQADLLEGLDPVASRQEVV